MRGRIYRVSELIGEIDRVGVTNHVQLQLLFGEAGIGGVE